MIRTALAALLLAASPAIASDGHGKDGEHLAEAEGVRILHAWTTVTKGDTTRVYLEIQNTGDADLTIVGAGTDIGSSVTLVGLNYSSSGAPPEPLGEFPVPAGSGLDLTPDGLFLLIEGLEETLGEDEGFRLQLELDPVGEIEIHVDVEPEGTKQHPHAGHNH